MVLLLAILAVLAWVFIAVLAIALCRAAAVADAGMGAERPAPADSRPRVPRFRRPAASDSAPSLSLVPPSMPGDGAL